MAHRTSARDVVSAIKDVDFPAGKDDLVQAASRSGAAPDVVKALRGIPAEQYANREEVARSVRVDPDSDLGPWDGARVATLRCPILRPGRIWL